MARSNPPNLLVALCKALHNGSSQQWVRCNTTGHWKWRRPWAKGVFFFFDKLWRLTWVDRLIQIIVFWNITKQSKWQVNFFIFFLFWLCFYSKNSIHVHRTHSNHRFLKTPPKKDGIKNRLKNPKKRWNQEQFKKPNLEERIKKPNFKP